jgi:L-cysteine/cystine lyase
LLAVDGAQSAGAIPLDLHALDVDFYAIPGQKWLCGPEGMGALYVRRARQSELAPTYMGYASMGTDGGVDFSGYYMPASSARRYEIGSIHWPALAGMRASLAWLQDELGMAWVYERVTIMTRRCREILAELPGATVHTPANHAGLTAFTVDGLDPASTPTGLAEMGILIRSVREPDLLRVSTGFFTDEEDLQRLAEGLQALQAVK